jgi:hypothetical protein
VLPVDGFTGNFTEPAFSPPNCFPRQSRDASQVGRSLRLPRPLQLGRPLQAAWIITAKLAIDSLRPARRQFAAQVGQPLRPLEFLMRREVRSAESACVDFNDASKMAAGGHSPRSGKLAAGKSVSPLASPSRNRFAQADLPIRPAKSAQRVLPSLSDEPLQPDPRSTNPLRSATTCREVGDRQKRSTHPS